MARSGMANLIARLRKMVNDAGAATWTDGNLQDVLDEHRIHITHEKLKCEPRINESSVLEYYDFFSRYGDLEEGTAPIFCIEASTGVNRGTADYTANYVDGHILMGADQEGTVLYLTARSYDLAGAAADLWREKMAETSAYYSYKSDNQQINRSDWFTHCKAMADYYDRKARPMTVRMVRSDVVI